MKNLENFCKNVFAEADVMFAPPCPMAAPKIDETDIGVGDDMPDLNRALPMYPTDKLSRLTFAKCSLRFF